MIETRKKEEQGGRRDKEEGATRRKEQRGGRSNEEEGETRRKERQRESKEEEGATRTLMSYFGCNCYSMWIPFRFRLCHDLVSVSAVTLKADRHRCRLKYQ